MSRIVAGKKFLRRMRKALLARDRERRILMNAAQDAQDGGREGVRSPGVSPPVVLRLWRWLRHVVPVRRRVGGRSRA